MKLFLLLALLAFPAQAKTDCNGSWIDPANPQPPNPPCPQSVDSTPYESSPYESVPDSKPQRGAPEMGDLGCAFLVAGMVLAVLQIRNHYKKDTI